MAVSSPNGLKTQWEKEKLLVTSNSSFSHSVFKRLVLQTRENQGLFGKGLNWTSLKCLSSGKWLMNHSTRLFSVVFFNRFQNKPWFLRVCGTSPLKTLWEKLLVTSNFSFSHRVFYPFRKLSIIFVKF